MVEAFFGFKKSPFGDSPDAKQLFASQAWTQVKARLQFLVDHHGAGLLTGEVGAGKSAAARTFTAGLNPNLYKILYLHWTCGSALDLLRQLALELDLVPAHYQGLNHFLAAARAAAAEIVVLDPLYSTHDQDENDTRAMAALCQSLLRLREASGAALIVVHHVRKSIGRYEIGSAFRGSSALHAVGDSYLLLTRPAPPFHTVELRFQFRYAAPQPPRLLDLDPDTLWFSPAGQSARSGPATAPARRKVEQADITQALTGLGGQVRYNRLRDQIMDLTECSKRTAQLAITEACQQGWIVQTDGHYHLPV